MEKWLVYIDWSMEGDFDGIFGSSKIGDVTEVSGIALKWLQYLDMSLEGDFNGISEPSKIGDVTEIRGIWANSWHIWTGLWKTILMQYLDPRK